MLLTWEVRYKIALGLGSDLLYLHEESGQYVVHRDIKSNNIMLDSDFNAKLGDFGLARLMDEETGVKTTGLAGTWGYIAPEYASTGKATKVLLNRHLFQKFIIRIDEFKHLGLVCFHVKCFMEFFFSCFPMFI
jgi:serine/threonine protein kinase